MSEAEKRDRVKVTVVIETADMKWTESRSVVMGQKSGLSVTGVALMIVGAARAAAESAISDMIALDVIYGWTKGDKR